MVRFRKDLINELKRKSTSSPDSVQLFIPVEFRSGGRTFISNGRPKQTQLPITHISSGSKEWPQLTQTTANSHINASENQSNAIENMKQHIIKIENDYDKHETRLRST